MRAGYKATFSVVAGKTDVRTISVTLPLAQA